MPAPANAQPGSHQHKGALTITVAPILGAISFSHLLNDTMQSLPGAIYPLLKGDFQLSLVQIGLITLVYQICASLPLLSICAVFLPDQRMPQPADQPVEQTPA